MTEIDLTPYGVGAFQCQGTLQTKRLTGKRLLLLFGERHSLKPFIRDTLLNVVKLDKLGVLSCVGVEGHPEKDVPGSQAQQAFELARQEHEGSDEKLIGGVLDALKGGDFYFWKTLVLVRPALTVQSVDDAALCNSAGNLEGHMSIRFDQISETLRRSDLFDANPLDMDSVARDRRIEAKAQLQTEQEWAEHSVNVARDSIMLQNLLVLWERSGLEKIAILNAGSSHQWRIARLLPQDIAYYHIEQP